MPVEDSVFVVVLPNYFEHGKNILAWALQNVAKDADSLVIVHVHEQASPNELKEKLGEYVAIMCGRRKVKCVQLNEDDDVVEGLRKKHIELKDITKLVVGVEAELHSEITKSLNYKMQTEAPPCMIWFIACKGPLTLTGHLAMSIDDFWIRRILQMSGNKHRISSLHKLDNNTGSDADICDGFTSVVEMVERIKEEYEGKLREVTSKRSTRNKELPKEKSPSKVKSPAKSPVKSPAKSSTRYSKRIEKEKSCHQRELQDAMDEKSHLRKQIQEMESAIEFLKIARNEYFQQEPEAAVTEAGGLGEEKEKVVQEAKENGELGTVVKATAWDWRPELAKRLAHIGLRCVGMMSGLELERSAEAPRDDLAEEFRQLFDAADRLFDAGSQEQAEAQAPDHTISCVLNVDPHNAADGHTYDPESINAGWFTYGNDLSRVTTEMIQDKKLIRDLKWPIERWMVEHQGQVRNLNVCDPNPVQSSQQVHPTIPSAAQSQPPTDPVTSRPLTPPDITSASSSTLSRVIRLLTEDDDAGSPTLSLPPPTRIRQ